MANYVKVYVRKDDPLYSLWSDLRKRGLIVEDFPDFCKIAAREKAMTIEVKARETLSKKDIERITLETIKKYQNERRDKP